MGRRDPLRGWPGRSGGGMAYKHALCIGLALMTSACMGQNDTKLADQATDQFYRQVAAKQYQAIYDNAAPELRGAVSAAIFVGFMQRVDRKFGVCQPPAKRFDWHITTTPTGTARDQGYTRICAGGRLQESVTVVVRNGVAQFAGYHALNPQLLTN
jgi:hypothetical protein